MLYHTLLWLLLLAPNAAPNTPDTKVQLYQEALRLTKQQKYKAATQRWERLVGIFQRELTKHSAGSRAHSQQLMGQCHVLYHLAETQWKAKNKWAACHTRERLEKQRKAIAPRWLKHAADASLARVFLRSQKQLRTSCATLPAKLTLKLTPKSTTVRFQRKGKWYDAKGHTLEVVHGPLTLELSAPGHSPQTHALELPRWKETTRSFALKRAPITRPIPRRVLPPKVLVTKTRRRPPPPRIARIKTPPPRPRPPVVTPFYKTWWFWTITSVAVAGTTTAIIAATLASPPPGFVHDPNSPLQLPSSTE